MPRVVRLRASAWAGWLLPLLTLAAPAATDGVAARRLAADGRPLTLEIKEPGDRSLFVFVQRSGCRYRLSVEPITLERPVVDFLMGDTPQRFGAPERGQPAVFEWDAEGERALEATVSGFSALTGTARIRLAALGPDGQTQPAPRPWLGVTGERAKVGDLLLGDSERWELVVEPGRAYEVEPLRGTALGVSLRVLEQPGGRELASASRPWLPFEALAFRAPTEPPPPTEAPTPPAPPGPQGAPGLPTAARAPGLVLEVRGARGAGGTYGLRLRALPDGAPLESAPAQPPSAVVRGLLDAEPLAFRAQPGDVAILFVPAGQGAVATTLMSARLGEAWVPLGPDAPLATMRTPEGQHLAWFRPEQPGTYRFGVVPGGAPPGVRPLLIPGEPLGGAPVLIAVQGDPSVRARLTSAWQLVGAGVVMPGFEYLFVAEGAPTSGVAMRVVGLEGKTLASRPASGEGLTFAQGLGPSLRFRVAAPGLVRLEAKGNKHVVRALLRRASN